MKLFKYASRFPKLAGNSIALAVLWAISGTAVFASNLVVNDLSSDSAASGNGLCTLREAINNANSDVDTTGGDCTAGSGVDNITFSVDGTLVLGSTLTISDTAGLSIDGIGKKVILSGNNNVRVMQVNSGTNLTLKNLTVANGLANGGGFAGSGIGGGGGINNQYGNLTIDRCTFTGNTSTGNGGGIANYGDVAAAVPNGNLNITNSTFANNSASFGGAILNGHGNIWGSHLTVVGNSAVTPACPAGFFCTASVNEGGGIFNALLSGAAVQPDFLKLENSIIAGNLNIIKRTNLTDLTYASDIKGYVTQGNNNLIGSPDGILSGLQNGINGNIVGIDVNTILSAALTDNGGPTQTLALLIGSLALDSALAANCPTSDQRGIARPQGSACDIGAFETEVLATADLSISESAVPNPVMVKDALNWKIVVSNLGAANATGVKITNTLPLSGFSSIVVSPSQGTCVPPTNGKITCNLGNLAKDASATVSIKGTTSIIGTLTNSVSVSGDQPDNQQANNSVTQSVTVQALRCNGKTPTIVGTPGNNTLRGTSRSDVIQGLGGNDIIYGADGNDTICGGEGQDLIKGEGGNDTIDGGADTDSCDGGKGTDSASNCEARTNIP